MSKRKGDESMNLSNVSNASSLNNPKKKKSKTTVVKSSNKTVPNKPTPTPSSSGSEAGKLIDHMSIFAKINKEMRELIEEIKPTKTQTAQIEKLKNLSTELIVAVNNFNIDSLNMVKSTMANKQPKQDQTGRVLDSPKEFWKNIEKVKEDEKSVVIHGMDNTKSNEDITSTIDQIIQSTEISHPEKFYKLGNSNVVKLVLKSKDDQIKVLKNGFKTKPLNIKIKKYLDKNEQEKMNKMSSMIQDMKEKNPEKNLELVIYKNKICHRRQNGSPSILSVEEIKELTSSTK
uniref:Uncharacterized protein n=1 Tax=Panagrolaimus sp. JU765 TaxID=591449 RepID=A0AC34QHZ2_9BILA